MVHSGGALRVARVRVCFAFNYFCAQCKPHTRTASHRTAPPKAPKRDEERTRSITSRARDHMPSLASIRAALSDHRVQLVLAAALGAFAVYWFWIRRSTPRPALAQAQGGAASDKTGDKTADGGSSAPPPKPTEDQAQQSGRKTQTDARKDAVDKGSASAGEGNDTKTREQTTDGRDDAEGVEEVNDDEDDEGDHQGHGAAPRHEKTALPQARDENDGSSFDAAAPTPAS